MDDEIPTFACNRDRHLFELQRRVAQRADTLARLLGNRPGLGVELWHQAESELWKEIASDLKALKEFLAKNEAREP